MSTTISSVSVLTICFALSVGCSSNAGPTLRGNAGASPSGGGGGEPGGAGAVSAAGAATSSGAGGGGGAEPAPTAGGGGVSGGAGGLAGGGSATAGSAGAGGLDKSSGCGKDATLQSGTITLQSAQKNRSYVLRVPENYDKDHPYRLILGFHGATGNANQVAPEFFGLWELAQGSAIFIAANGLGQDGAPAANNLFWYNEGGEDLVYIDDVIAQVEAALCIDKKKIALEGFSMGGAMVWTAACARPGAFSAAVVHSGGGQPRPVTCEPMPFMSSLGAQESNGTGQASNSDFFALEMGCTVEALPKAPQGGHACSDYPGCPATAPVRWCDYDGGHLPNPKDDGESMSWMPEEVWQFVSRF